MITTDDVSDLPLAGSPGSVVSIGVFDGVHLGHEAILAANVARARELDVQPTVVTFGRHPKGILLGRAPRTLTTLAHRLELFRRAGIVHTLVLNFDETLRSMPAPEFTRSILIERLAAESFVLGFDSKFGKGQAGGPVLLRELGHDVHVVPKVTVGSRAVSSTAIREAVELGDLAGAARMLGRPVSVFGDVVRGEALGRRIGFPTANLDLHHELHPPTGVYACRAHIVDPDNPLAARASHDAVANIGFRPTVSGERPAEPLVEVHLLDCGDRYADDSLYGEHVELEFLRHLRPEQRFDGLTELRAQIARDVAEARRMLAEH
ncbi:MAG: riboflavin biosynthesis protein RibF [bacterium]|nr:riboflavin biosynthesis protein RibF [bacterium]